MPIQQILLVGASSLTVTANPSSIYIQSFQSGTLSRTVTVGVSGGVPPYTYFSEWVSGGSGMSIYGYDTSAYTVSGTGSPALHLSGVVRTTVTDSAGNTGTVNVPVDLVWDA